MKDIRALLAQEAPLVFDGAAGTYFAARYGGSCELASLEQPEQVLQMHRAYLDAGCQAVKTNTFALGAMYQEGGESLARKAILAGCMLAREAAAPYGAYVFGDLGPVAALEDADPAAIYLAQAQLFLSQGITHFLLETLSSDQGVADFARQLKALCPSAFLLVSFGVQPDGYTREGLSASRLLAGMQACEGVDAAGFNCVCGPQHMLRQIRRLDAKDALLSAMPNAGYPTVLGRRVVYRGQPDYFAQQGVALVRAGAKIIGGCCGTTPAHIAALVQAIRREKPVAAQAPAVPAPAPAPAPRPPRAPWPPIPFGISWKPASGWWWWSWTPRPRAAPSPLWRPPPGSRPPARTGSPWRIVPSAGPGRTAACSPASSSGSWASSPCPTWPAGTGT